MDDEQDPVNPTKKAKAFLDALRALCASHGVLISSSHYDSLQIWDANPGDKALHFNGIEDFTKP